MSKIEYLTEFVSKRLDATHIQMTEPFVVKDGNGREWDVPKGFVSDGESSPPILEPISGDPFNGTGLIACVVHDKYCKTRERLQKDTHKIFYDLLKHEIKTNDEFGWILCLPWDNKAWQYSKAFIKWQLVTSYNKTMYPKWL